VPPSTLSAIARQAPFWLFLSAALGLVASRNFLLFHGLAEIFSIVIAAGIFMFAWSSRRLLPNDYLLFVGIAYLFVGSIDLLHTLAYKGMGVLSDYGANEATQLWIAARYLESLSLLAAPLFINRRLRTGLALAGYGAVFTLLAASIFFWDLFPRCYVEGEGLTSFKIVSEYIIAALLLGAVGHLLYHRQHFERDVLQLLIASLAVTISAELTFTTYISVYSWANFSGHLLKILSFYLIYLAIIRTGLLRPYSLLFRDLKKSQEELRREKVLAESLIDTTQAVVLLLDKEGRILHFNPYFEKISGRSLQEMAGKNWLANFVPAGDHNHLRRHFIEGGTAGTSERFIGAIIDRTGIPLAIEWANRPLTNEQNEVIGLLCTGHNITEILRAEQEREQLILELQAALGEVKTLSGLLPICASCKNIRDDKGYWNQIEVYIRQHSDADFTHGICPDCARKLYPEIYHKLRSSGPTPDGPIS
jgi:PAS domain S-box-containing protein